MIFAKVYQPQKSQPKQGRFFFFLPVARPWAYFLNGANAAASVARSTLTRRCSRVKKDFLLAPLDLCWLQYLGVRVARGCQAAAGCHDSARATYQPRPPRRRPAHRASDWLAGE